MPHSTIETPPPEPPADAHDAQASQSAHRSDLIVASLNSVDPAPRV
jgi:hypothetical protein